jgi:mono/diheme cytochrome c family protein
LVVNRVAAIGGIVLASLPHARGLSDEDPGQVFGVLSVRDGVYSEAQARRGEFVYPSVCGRCHGRSLDGAPDDPDMFSTPPIAGPKFLREWSGRSLASLYEYTRTTMPAINPGSLSDQEFADVVAYLLRVSGFPPGAVELRPDPGELAAIVIDLEP